MTSAIKKSKVFNTILSLNNQHLDRVCSYTYLGFAIDEHLNYSSVPKRQVAVRMRRRSAHVSGTTVLASVEGTRILNRRSWIKEEDEQSQRLGEI